MNLTDRKGLTAGAGVSLLLFCLAYPLWVRDHQIDFDVHYEAGRRVLRAERLYRPEVGHYVYKYPPAAAVLEMPLSLLPRRVAKFVFYTLTCLAMLATFVLSFRLLPCRPAPSGWWFLFAFLILGRFFFREILLGQINLFIVLALLIMLWVLDDAGPIAGGRRQLRAGAIWGAALIPKPYALVFAPYFLLTRRWTALIGGLLFVGFLSLTPALFYGWQGNLELHAGWLDILSRSTPGQLRSRVNVSLAAMWIKWTGDPRLSMILSLSTVLVLAILVLQVVRRGHEVERPLILDGGLLMVLIPILSPQGWDYLLQFSILGVMLLLQHRRALPTTWRRLLEVNFLALWLPWVVGPLHPVYLNAGVETVLTLVNVVLLAKLRFERIC